MTTDCRVCGHRFDAHQPTPDGYHCRVCLCKRRFWR